MPDSDSIWNQKAGVSAPAFIYSTEIKLTSVTPCDCFKAVTNSSKEPDKFEMSKDTTTLAQSWIGMFWLMVMIDALASDMVLSTSDKIPRLSFNINDSTALRWEMPESGKKT